MLIVNAASYFPSSPPMVANDQVKQGLSRLFSDQPVETFQRGETIYRDGDPAMHVFEIVSGIVRMAKIFSDGSRVITVFVHPGEMFGLSAREHYLTDAEAVGDVKLRKLKSDRFRRAVDNSEELRPQFFNWLHQEMASVQARVVMLARKKAEERICDLLLTLARRANDKGNRLVEIEIPISRVDMADYLGLSIETVSRTMTNLIKRGVIRSITRYRFSIRNLSLLKELADGGDEYDAANCLPRERQAMRAC